MEWSLFKRHTDTDMWAPPWSSPAQSGSLRKPAEWKAPPVVRAPDRLLEITGSLAVWEMLQTPPRFWGKFFPVDKPSLTTIREGSIRKDVFRRVSLLMLRWSGSARRCAPQQWRGNQEKKRLERKERKQGRERVGRKGEGAERKRSRVGGRGRCQPNSPAAGGSGAEGSRERPPVGRWYWGASDLFVHLKNSIQRS